MKTEKALSKVFDIPFEKEEKKPVITLPEAKQATEITTVENDQTADYNFSRNTFRDLVKQGNLAMEDMVSLARESESPRAYEVLATMMKTIADTTDQLINLQKKMKELKTDKNNPNEDARMNIEKGVVFVGSTSELLKKVKNEDI